MEAEQYADIFARCAVTGKNDELTKLASEFGKSAAFDMASLQAALSNPAIRNSLIGAGAGGLLGLAQPKRKGINALQLALMGGLGGLGATYAFPGIFGGATNGNSTQGNAATGGAGTGTAASAAEPGSAVPVLDPTKLTPEQRAARETGEGSPVASTVGGAAAGGWLGSKLTKGMADRSADRLGRLSADQLRTYAGSKGRDAKAVDTMLNQFASGPNREENVNRFVENEARRQNAYVPQNGPTATASKPKTQWERWVDLASRKPKTPATTPAPFDEADAWNRLSGKPAEPVPVTAKPAPPVTPTAPAPVVPPTPAPVVAPTPEPVVTTAPAASSIGVGETVHATDPKAPQRQGAPQGGNYGKVVSVNPATNTATVNFGNKRNVTIPLEFLASVNKPRGAESSLPPVPAGTTTPTAPTATAQTPAPTAAGTAPVSTATAQTPAQQIDPHFEQRVRNELDSATRVLDRGRISARPFKGNEEAKQLADLASRVTGKNVSAPGLRRDLRGVQRPAGMARRGVLPSLLRLFGTAAGTAAGAYGGAMANEGAVNYHRNQLQNRYEEEAARAAANSATQPQ